MRKLVLAAALLSVGTFIFAQNPQPKASQNGSPFSPHTRQYISVEAPTFALTHVRVIDGTGAAPREDQTIIVVNGKIQRVGDAASVQPPQGAKVLEKRGYTVIPGLVGMHNHMYYTAGLNLDEHGAMNPPGFLVAELPYTAAHLYLGCGVTSMRTTGSVEPYTDEDVKQAIDQGRMPGPKMHLSAPYFEGKGGAAAIPQMHELTGPDDARRMVDFWSAQGFTSIKAYMHITHAELAAAVDEAHKKGIKVTGHLCSIGFREAAEIGIDNLEHGLLVDTEFTPNKQQDVCPPGRDYYGALAKVEVNGPDVQQTIRTMVERKVALTSTLPVFEAGVPNRPPLQHRVLEAMLPESRISYLSARARIAPDSPFTALFKKEMQFEYAFAKAGGVLMAGPDPTGNGATLPGFGDQRELELLVETGFTPVEAIKIYTLNGAQFLGEQDKIGSIAEGKQADMVLINGNPAANIGDVEEVETVFKDGVGFDSAKLIDSVRGQVGLR
jgi:imidazolonepropionase-like amidohydrolase